MRTRTKWGREKEKGKGYIHFKDIYRVEKDSIWCFECEVLSKREDFDVGKMWKLGDTKNIWKLKVSKDFSLAIPIFWCKCDISRRQKSKNYEAGQEIGFDI